MSPQSVVMNIQGEFDQMIHNVVTKVNDILAKAAGVQTGDLKLADGTTRPNVRYCVSDPNGYMRMRMAVPSSCLPRSQRMAMRR